MKWFKRLLGATILGAVALLFWPGETVDADRAGGPASEVRTVAPFRSVFFDTVFLADRPAIVEISGNGATNLELMLYDSDNHITVGVGAVDQKKATMNVYRTGSFRIEVRNLGAKDNTFLITTN
jgi:hypothetical protein